MYLMTSDFIDNHLAPQPSPEPSHGPFFFSIPTVIAVFQISTFLFRTIGLTSKMLSCLQFWNPLTHLPFCAVIFLKYKSNYAIYQFRFNSWQLQLIPWIKQKARNNEMPLNGSQDYSYFFWILFLSASAKISHYQFFSFLYL